MYAVIKTGGKQYKVAANDVIRVEKLPGNAGDIISLDQVLMIGDDSEAQIGTPLLAGKSVTAEILEQGKAKKIIVFKKNRRKNYRRTQGHRQQQTVLRITAIGGKKAPEKKAEAKKETKPAAKKEAVPQTKVKKAEVKKAPAKKLAKAKAAPQKATAQKTTVKKAAAKKPASSPKEKK